ncbi:uncharacterized protein [Ptychodera flava]|uniref:uncharacterized protein n=1 Tax=Ptychodera flava TaxID=63121 RepID=UPI003969D29F
MATLNIFRRLLQLFPVLVCVGTCLACSEPLNWKARPFIDRASQATIIAYGLVIEKFPPEEGGYHFWPDGYDAEVEFYCILRGDSQIEATANVTGLGFYPGMCTDNAVEEGQEYILFLGVTDEGKLEVRDINVETGAVSATEDYLRQVTTLCDLELKAPTGGAACPADLASDVEQTTDENCYRSAARDCYANTRYYWLVLCLMTVNVIKYFPNR